MNIKKLLLGWIFAAEFRHHAEVEQALTDEQVRFQSASSRAEKLDRKLEFAALELEAAHALVAKWKPKPARFDRYRSMDEDQLAEVLAGAGELPAVKGITQMVDEKFQQASDESRDPELDEKKTNQALGGAEWLLKLKAELQAALEQERKPEARR